MLSSRSVTVADMAFTVLVVCTGNTCRSPMAERLLASRLGGLVEVSSAGTQALTGLPMTDQAASITRRWGAEPAGHSARQLDRHALRDGLAAARGRWQGASPSDDDVEDPYGASDVTYARTAGTIHHAVEGLVSAVRPDRQG